MRTVLHVELEMMLDLNQTMLDWRPPVKRVVASRGEGIDELSQSIAEYVTWAKESSQFESRRHARSKTELLNMLDQEMGRYVRSRLDEYGSLDELVASIERREKDPYSVVNTIVARVLR